MSWKKRGQAGWTGKKEAKSKERRERNYAKGEIRQEMKKIEEGEDYREKAGSKKKNKIASLKHWRDWYLRRAEEAKAKKDNCIWTGFTTYSRRAEEMDKQIEEMENKDRH